MAEVDIAALYEQYRDFDLVVDSRQVSRPAQTLFLRWPVNGAMGIRMYLAY